MKYYVIKKEMLDQFIENSDQRAKAFLTDFVKQWARVVDKGKKEKQIKKNASSFSFNINDDFYESLKL